MLQYLSMIRCTLLQLMAHQNVDRAARGLPPMTRTELAAQIGIDRHVLSRLANNQFQGIERNTMDLLCRFFKVQPGDLFDYIPGGDGPDVE